VLFVLPISEPGGGGNVVFQEARAMQRMGVDVRIANLARHREVFEAGYSQHTVPVLYVNRPHQLGELLGDYDAVIATLYASVEWLAAPASEGYRPVRGYYIQDFEPYFFSKNSREYRLAWQSYTYYPDLVRITKTDWNKNTVKAEIGADCTVVGPSVDVDLYRPRRRRDPGWPSGPLRIAAMIRPSSPRRQPRLTMEVLRELHRTHGAEVEIVLFGCSSHEPGFVELPHDFAWRNAGILKPSQLAPLLNNCDIFVDFSSFQAMGLTAMEAMACGVAVIVPQQGGTDSFARSEANCLLVDTTSYDDCRAALERLIADAPLRQHLRRQALWDMVQYFPERAAYNTLAALFPIN
jgi:glycosyltransferase involved in cell wall biosynthesis